MKSIPIKKPFDLPDYVSDALKKLRGNGHEAYVVGGSVRDHLLGTPTKDHDIATSALPEEVESLFENSLSVGKFYGVIKVPVKTPWGHQIVEITTFREDLEYADHRHPVSVRFANIQTDALRRDFTINALYYDGDRNCILDFVGGLKDLDHQTIRAIGDPDRRFDEDALRLLRAVRFSGRFHFEIHKKTLNSMVKNVGLLKAVSAERIRDELAGILGGPAPQVGVALMKQLGMLGEIFNPITLDSDSLLPFGDALRVLEKWGDSNQDLHLGVGWCIFLMAVSRNTKGVANHLSRLKFSGEESAFIEDLAEDYQKGSLLASLGETELMRWSRKKHFSALLDLWEMVSLSKSQKIDGFERGRQAFARYSKIENPLHGILDGSDLIQLGLKPGPKFKEILRDVETQVLLGKINSREEGLDFIRRIIQRNKE